jgi:hypothetical protein
MMSAAAEAFERLGSLAGSWTGVFANGGSHEVSYRLIAGGTVLVENWQLAPGREALTLYHLDGDALIATHYCPAGNQPTLRWTPSPDDRFVFDFVSATNLATESENHQHRFELRLLGPDSFWRSETYLENGVEDVEAVTYARVGGDAV